jgi:hypothetical protein
LVEVPDVISDDATLKDYSYEPLICGGLYTAEVSNKYYTLVFFTVDGTEYELVVHNRHLQFLEPDEYREEKLKELGI